MNKKIKILIIGFGNFGTLIASILNKYALVEVYHYRQKSENIAKAKKIGLKLVSLDSAKEANIVILATPISKTKNTIKKVAPLLKKGALFLDTCSVKVAPCNWLKKYSPKNIEIMGTHPMFGPVSTKFDLDKQKWSLNGLQIILCPLRIKKENLSKIKKFLKSLGLKVIISSAKEHDKQNAKTLSLVHYLGRALLRVNITEQKIYTPGYKNLLSIVPHIDADTKQLFYDMNNYNPYAKELRKKFLKALIDIDKEIIKNNHFNDT